MSGSKNIVGTEQRFATGCIASFTDGTSRHFAGVGKHATATAAEWCDRHGLQIVCLSTLSTIYRDLQGHRGVSAPREADRRSRQDLLRTPELPMLAAIHRTYLLA